MNLRRKQVKKTEFNTTEYKQRRFSVKYWTGACRKAVRLINREMCIRDSNKLN